MFGGVFLALEALPQRRAAVHQYRHQHPFGLQFFSGRESLPTANFGCRGEGSREGAFASAWVLRTRESSLVLTYAILMLCTVQHRGVRIADAMVTARMSQEKKRKGNRVLEHVKLNAPHWWRNRAQLLRAGDKSCSRFRSSRRRKYTQGRRYAGGGLPG